MANFTSAIGWGYLDWDHQTAGDLLSVLNDASFALLSTEVIVFCEVAVMLPRPLHALCMVVSYAAPVLQAHRSLLSPELCQSTLCPIFIAVYQGGVLVESLWHAFYRIIGITGRMLAWDFCWDWVSRMPSTGSATMTSPTQGQESLSCLFWTPRMAKISLHNNSATQIWRLQTLGMMGSNSTPAVAC